MKLAPICLFAFNRPEHTARTLAALAANSLAAESDLHIFCDGPRTEADLQSVALVRMIANSVSGFRRVLVHESDSNRGLATSITSGVSEVIAMYGRVIVLEDDILTAAEFLPFMNRALDAYEANDVVGSVSGYSFPLSSVLPATYFLRIASSWAWATWARAWRDYNPDGTGLLQQLCQRQLLSEFDCSGTFPYSQMLQRCIAGEVDSWAIRWYASCFLHSRLTLFPRDALAQNIGHDGTGRHCPPSSVFEVELATAAPALLAKDISECLAAREALSTYFRTMRPTLRQRLESGIRRALGINAT